PERADRPGADPWAHRRARHPPGRRPALGSRRRLLALRPRRHRGHAEDSWERWAYSITAVGRVSRRVLTRRNPPLPCADLVGGLRSPPWKTVTKRTMRNGRPGSRRIEQPIGPVVHSRFWHKADLPGPVR